VVYWAPHVRAPHFQFDGENQNAPGGSSTGFNDLASAGGLGSGSTEASTSGIAGAALIAFNGNEAATGTFNGNGSGINGNGVNQPNTGGTVIGSGNGSGTALVGASSYSNQLYLVEPEAFKGDATFKSTGGGSGFVDGTLGTASGSAFGGASGGASGTANGIGRPRGNGLPVTYGSLAFSGSSAANGIGAFIGGFSPSLEDGPTGGSGSGSGSLSVAGSGRAEANQLPFIIGDASGSGTAETFGGGSANVSNIYGEAGGLGSGATTGSASGGFKTLYASVLSGAGTSTGNFDTMGSGSFGVPTVGRTFP
jgi:hypothetical protein